MDMEGLKRMRALAREAEEGKEKTGGDAWQSGSGESTSCTPQVRFGYALSRNLQGRRMEDFHVAEIRQLPDGKEIGLFAIFDAHKGSYVAVELQRRLFDNILGEGGVWADPAGAVRDGYLLTDRQLLESPFVTKDGGSTAVTAMLIDNGRRLVVANVGDSRAILSRDGVTAQLTVDHKPGGPIERASVESRGGVVLTMPGDVPRVDGQLAVARGFGDKALKPHISVKPDVCDLVVDVSFEFLILASNGLWEVLSSEEAGELTRHIQDPAEAAKSLILHARERLTDHDIGCIVVRFHEP